MRSFICHAGLYTRCSPFCFIRCDGCAQQKGTREKLYDLQEKEDTFNLGIMMFDLNNLKKINDTYGHELPQSLLSDSGFDENS